MNALSARLAAFVAGVVLCSLICPALADDWTRIGGDSGMTRYSADNITSSSLLTLSYSKRFYSAYCDDPSAAYFDANTILVRNGTAMVMSSDAPYAGSGYGQSLAMTFFNLATGAVTQRASTPSETAWGINSIYMGENMYEIDSNHFSAAMVWNSDGKIYARRGGDHYATGAYDVATNTWTKLQQLKSSPNYSNWGGDTGAFINTWGDRLIYRPGDTRDTGPYIATDISAAAYAAGTAGAWKTDLGPDDVPTGSSDDGLRYGDIPKISPSGISVVCGYSLSPSSVMVVQATDLTTNQKLWSKQYAATPGDAGFHTVAGNALRFLAADNNTFVMFSGTSAMTLRALDMTTGNEKWNKAITASDSPLLAASSSSVYVIGKSQQMKMDLVTGQVLWTKTNTFTTSQDQLNGFDPISRPIVVTDDTLWFIDGMGPKENLVGMRTSDGLVIQTIDLKAMVAAQSGESLLSVQDMACANGRISVLLNIGVSNDPNGTTTNGAKYQDVYTFTPAPEPATLCLLGMGAAAMLRRRR